LANAFYGLFILPESLPRSRRSRFDWQRANPFGALALLRSHAALFGLAAMHFLGDLAHAVLPSVSVLYMMYRYGWNQSVVGLTLAAVGFASIIVQSLVVGPVIRRVGERAALMLGLMFGVAGFLIFALAPTGLIFWLAIPLMALWGLEGPACMALMSRLVGSSEQGRLQGGHFQRGRHRQYDRALSIHPDFRVRHRQRPEFGAFWRAVSDRGGAAAFRRDSRVVGNAEIQR
jgi:DHA1 family tetracycline resistance protein-like MFS transporter